MSHKNENTSLGEFLSIIGKLIAHTKTYHACQVINKLISFGLAHWFVDKLKVEWACELTFKLAG